jgi:RNA polymerase sigma-70 factor (ECF subfamily)
MSDEAGDDRSDPRMTAATRQPPEPDAAIIARSVREPACFAAVFDRHYATIHGYVARRLGEHLADDLASETFLTAFARRTRYDQERADARPWLFGIASNLVARHHRAEQRRYRALARTGVDEVSAGHADEVAGRLDATARQSALAAALAAVPARERDVLLLVAWAELTSEQAGQALGIPAGTARSRLHRARGRLRVALDRTNERMTDA